MAEYVAEFGRDGQPAGRTAGSTRPRSTAITRRSWRRWRFLDRKAETCWRSAAAPASTRSNSPAPPVSRGGRATNDSHLRSIAAWRAHAKLANLRPPCGSMPSRMGLRDKQRRCRPIDRDVLRQRHPHRAVAVAEGLFAGAARHLRRTASCFLRPVPPRRRAQRAEQRGVRTSLRRENPEWGVRDTADLKKLGAGRMGFASPSWSRCRPTTPCWCSSADKPVSMRGSCGLVRPADLLAQEGDSRAQ